MLYLLAGPVVCVLGIVAVFFVLRRKSVEKQSMYSARRRQIEHKVRAARQRTLAPHGHAQKPSEVAASAPSPFADVQAQQPTVIYPQQPAASYEPAAYQAAPAAPPTPPPAAQPPQPAWETPSQPAPMPWETGPSGKPAPASAAPGYDYPPSAPPEPFAPAPEPTPRAAPSEPAWTPAPAPLEPAIPIEQPVAAAASTSAGGWSVVTTTKDEKITAEPSGKKKDKKQAVSGSEWMLASGDAPGTEAEEETEGTRSSATVVAAAQYAVLVVGLVMVLIGVLVMVANSHVT